MKQQWHELEEFPDYAVSNYGEIANMKTGLTRKVSINQQGIPKISLYKGPVLCTRSLSVLVAEAFVPKENEHFDTPIHLDGDRANCRADNLTWRARWFAIMFHKQFRDEKLYIDKATRVELKTGNQYETMLDVVTTLGVLREDVFHSHFNGTPVFPGGLRFRMI